MADIGAISKISIHAPPRGATASCDLQSKERTLFQFTPLREGRRRGSKNISRQSYFNSRPSARGDWMIATMLFASDVYFNSRPSARGDEEMQRVRQKANISIHAPPRGATVRATQDAIRRLISIHAPPRGATNRAERRRAARDIFQFTPLREGRRSPYS